MKRSPLFHDLVDWSLTPAQSATDACANTRLDGAALIITLVIVRLLVRGIPFVP